MIALLQRVSRAEVTVEGHRIAAVGSGVLALIGVERNDDERAAKRLAERLVQYRIFADAAGRMNRSVRDVGGAVLLVPQFTLAADTRRGNRPGFSTAADPESGKRLFDLVVHEVAAAGVETATGRFGAAMQVSLTNEGPVTFWLQVPSIEAAAVTD
jgi:D-tyrosyl-tRNA(Tyr) deacylase